MTNYRRWESYDVDGELESLDHQFEISDNRRVVDSSLASQSKTAASVLADAESIAKQIKAKAAVDALKARMGNASDRRRSSNSSVQQPGDATPHVDKKIAEKSPIESSSNKDSLASSLISGDHGGSLRNLNDSTSIDLKLASTVPATLSNEEDISGLLSRLSSSLSSHFENLEKIRFYSSDPARYYDGFAEGVKVFQDLVDLWKNNPLGVSTVMTTQAGAAPIGDVIEGSRSAINYLLSLTAHFTSLCAVSINRPAAAIELCRYRLKLLQTPISNNNSSDPSTSEGNASQREGSKKLKGHNMFTESTWLIRGLALASMGSFSLTATNVKQAAFLYSDKGSSITGTYTMKKDSSSKSKLSSIAMVNNISYISSYCEIMEEKWSKVLLRLRSMLMADAYMRVVKAVDIAVVLGLEKKRLMGSNDSNNSSSKKKSANLMHNERCLFSGLSDSIGLSDFQRPMSFWYHLLLSVVNELHALSLSESLAHEAYNGTFKRADESSTYLDIVDSFEVERLDVDNFEDKDEILEIASRIVKGCVIHSADLDSDISCRYKHCLRDIIDGFLISATPSIERSRVPLISSLMSEAAARQLELVDYQIQLILNVFYQAQLLYLESLYLSAEIKYSTTSALIEQLLLNLSTDPNTDEVDSAIQKRTHLLQSLLKSSTANVAACHCLRNSSSDCGRDVARCTSSDDGRGKSGLISNLNIGERFRTIYSLIQIKKYDIALDNAVALKDILIQYKSKGRCDVDLDQHVLYVSKPHVLSQFHLFSNVDHLLRSYSDKSTNYRGSDALHAAAPEEIIDEWALKLDVLIGRITVLRSNYLKREEKENK